MAMYVLTPTGGRVRARGAPWNVLSPWTATCAP